MAGLTGVVQCQSRGDIGMGCIRVFGVLSHAEGDGYLHLFKKVLEQERASKKRSVVGCGEERTVSCDELRQVVEYAETRIVKAKPEKKILGPGEIRKTVMRPERQELIECETVIG